MPLEPAYSPIVLRTGTTWNVYLRAFDEDGVILDLDGVTARMTIRAVDGSVALELTTPDNGLEISLADQWIACVITAAQTAALPPGEYHHDLLLTWPDGFVECPQVGPVTVIDTATEPYEAP